MAINLKPNFLKTKGFWGGLIILIVFIVVLKFGLIAVMLSKLKMIWIDYRLWSVIFLSVVSLIFALILIRRKAKLPKLVAGMLLIGLTIFLYMVTHVGKFNKTQTEDTANLKSKTQDSIAWVKRAADSLLIVEAKASAEKPLDSITKKIERKRFIADSIEIDNRKREIDLTAKAAAKKKMIDSADVLCNIDSRVDKLLADAKKLDSLAAALARSTTNPCEYVKPKKDVVKNEPPKKIGKKGNSGVSNRNVGVRTVQPKFKREVGVPTVQY